MMTTTAIHEAADDQASGSHSASKARSLRSIVAWRLVAAAGVLLAVTVVVFLFIHAAPGGPEQAIAGTDATPEQLAQIRSSYHLDDPLVVQYWTFLKSALQFDFGNSYTLREPITTLVWRAATQVTIPLLVMTWLIATSVGIALGYSAARSRGGLADRVIVAMTTVGACAPVFATSILIAYVFGVRLGWFPYLGAGEGFLDRLHHLVLPAATTTLVLLAGTTRLTRVRIAQTLDEDQVTFARARGLSPSYVTTKVVLRNSAVHLVTFSGSLVIALIGGTVIVEQIYGLPGIGSNLIQAINARDIPLVQGLTLFIAVVVVLVNLAVDLACLALDPRLRSGLDAAP